MVAATRNEAVTSAGRGLLVDQPHLRGHVLAIEAEARRETVRRIRHRVGIERAPTGNGQAAQRVRRWLDAILDEEAAR